MFSPKGFVCCHDLRSAYPCGQTRGLRHQRGDFRPDPLVRRGTAAQRRRMQRLTPLEYAGDGGMDTKQRVRTRDGQRGSPPRFNAMSDEVTWRWMGVSSWSKTFEGTQEVANYSVQPQTPSRARSASNFPTSSPYESRFRDRPFPDLPRGSQDLGPYHVDAPRKILRWVVTPAVISKAISGLPD
jgi:hypothetical protein